MVEALQVLLMTHGVLEPIPIEYNSYVLHLVEGFARAQEDIREAERACQAAKQSLERNFEQFRLVADDWLERESQYRAEVKRLEVFLFKSSQHGLEAVALARTTSIVDRSGFGRGQLLSRLKAFGKTPVNDPALPSVPSSTPDQESQTENQATQDRKNDNIGEIQVLERVPTPKILDNNNDFRMSEKIRQQDAATKASRTTSRSRRARWRSEALQPEPTYRELSVPTRTHVRDGISVDLLSSRTSRHRQDASVMPADSTFEYSIQVNEAATAQPVSQDEHDNSDFSFKPGDDSDPLLSSLAKEQGAPASRDYEQAPSHLADGNLQGERRHHDTYNTNDSITRSTSGTEQRSSVGSNNATVHCAPGGPHTASRKPLRECCDSGHGRQTMMESSPSQTSHSLDSPAAAFVPARETPERQLAEMDARIAATLALANVLGNTNQKK